MADNVTMRSPAQAFALIFGIVYLLIGIAGFFVTGFEDFTGEEGRSSSFPSILCTTSFTC